MGLVLARLLIDMSTSGTLVLGSFASVFDKFVVKMITHLDPSRKGFWKLCYSSLGSIRRLDYSHL